MAAVEHRHLALSFLAFVSLGLPDGLLGVAWPSMRRTFDVPLDALGALLVPFTASYVLSSVAAGSILARFPVGALLAASCVATGASLAGYAAAGSWAMVVALAALAGLGAGAIDTGVNAYVASRHGPRILNWMHAAYGLGAASGPLLMTSVLAASGPWQLGYAIVAAAQLLLGAAFVVSLGSWPPPAREPPTRGAEPGSRATPMQILRGRTVAIGVATFFLYVGVEASAGVWLFSLLTGRRLSTAEAGAAVAAYWASLAFGRVAFGVVAETRSLDRWLRRSLVLMIAAAFALAVARSPLAAFAAAAALGFGAGPVFPSLMASTPSRVPRAHVSSAVGLQIGGAALGQSLLPAAIGVAAGSLGLEAVALALIAGAAGVAGLHELLIRSRAIRR